MLATVSQPILVRTVSGSSQSLLEGSAEAGMDSCVCEGGKHGGREREEVLLPA